MEDGEMEGERQMADEEGDSKQHKMIDGADKGRSVYAGLTFIKASIDFPEAKCSLMLAATPCSTLCG